MEFDRQRVFQKIIAPVPLSVFLKKHWEKRPLYIAGTPAKFQDLFNRAALEEALKQPQIDELMLRASFTDARGQHIDVPVSSDQLLPLFNAGLTVSVSEIHKVAQRLNALRKEIRQKFLTGHGLVFHCFLSPPGKGFGMHLDNRSVLLLQIEGEKKWKFSIRPALSGTAHNIFLPPRGKKDPSFSRKGIVRPQEADFSEVFLRSGDVLYLPSGTWHQGRAGMKGSLGLTLSFVRFSARDIFEEFLSTYFDDSPVWQQILPAFEMQTLQRGSIPKDFKRVLSKRLAEMKSMMRKLTVTDLCSVWHMSATTPDYTFSKVSKKQKIGPKENLAVVRTEPATLLLASGGNAKRTVSLFFGGSEIPYSESAYPFLRALLKQARFTAGSAQYWARGQYSWQSIKTTLQDLYEIGLLART